MDFDLFSKLTQTPAASGREELLAQEVIKQIEPYCDKIHTDPIGNIIARKKGQGGKKIMLAAHLDEVALKVRYIADKGFIYFVLTGGIDPRTLLSQRVLIQTKSGEMLRGIIGAKAAHYLTAADKAAGIDALSLCIDTGLDAQQVQEKISIGDPVVLDRTAVELGGDLISSKAIDDRAGVYVLIELIKNLPKDHKNDLYFVFTVQEEFGLIGAQCAAFEVRPDYGIAVDTTGALDVPGIAPQNYVVSVGKGIGITLADSTTIADRALSEKFVEICKNKEIPFQLRVAARGSNDAKVIQRSAGPVKAIALSVPVRYIHSNVETASKNDIDAAYNLLLNFLTEGYDK